MVSNGTSSALNSEQDLASIPMAQGGLSRLAIALLKSAGVTSDLEHCLGGPPAVFEIWASSQFQKIATICTGIQFALELL